MQIAEPMSLRALLIGLHGRVGRQTWWLWGIVMPLGMALYFTVLLRVVGLTPRHTDIIVNLLLFWPTLAVSVKRWHDRNKSGWWVLIALVPFVGWIWVLVENGLLRGDAATNRFGDLPWQDRQPGLAWTAAGPPRSTGNSAPAINISP